MGLRWTSYVAPKPPPKGAQKGETAVCTIPLHLKRVCYKVFLCEYCQRQSFKTFTVLSIRAKMVRGERPLLRENLPETDPPSWKTIFGRSSSAVTLSEKSSFITNKKSTTRFLMSLRRKACVAPMMICRRSKTQSVQNLNNNLR